MQKIELRNYLNDISKELRSNEIIDIFNGKGPVHSNELIQLFIESKRGFDSTLNDKDYYQIYEQFDAKSMYDSSFFTQMISFIPTVQNQTRNAFLTHDSVNKFFSFHRSLINTYDLIKNVLIKNSEIFDRENNYSIEIAEDNGILILEVIDDKDVKLSKITETLTSLSKLIDAIYRVLDKIDSDKIDDIPYVISIDSGSDININIKLPKKATILISNLLKEFWEYLSDNKLYKLKKRNEALEDSLSLIKKIKNAEKENIIEREEAELLKRNILENTECIVFNNTLPKKILLESRSISNRELLMTKTKTLMLEPPKDEKDKS